MNEGDNDKEYSAPKKKVKKETVVKVPSKNKKQPKTQTAAMWQMVQSIERCQLNATRKQARSVLYAYTHVRT